MTFERLLRAKHAFKFNKKQTPGNASHQASNNVGDVNLEDVLGAFQHKPAGMFMTCHLVFRTFPQLMHAGVFGIPLEDRKFTIKAWNTLGTWICTAKSGLTKQERQLIFSSAYAMSAQLFSKEEVNQFIAHGSELTEQEVNQMLSKLMTIPVMKDHFVKPLLYWSLTVVGSDGLKPEQLERWLYIGNKWSVSQSDLSALLGMYYQERNLLQQMDHQFLGSSQVNSKL